jgi:hypothetical protein
VPLRMITVIGYYKHLDCIVAIYFVQRLVVSPNPLGFTTIIVVPSCQQHHAGCHRRASAVF